ncbi:DegT/DnrJ/EryC1/StrS family aminotransferase [Desulfoferrobacter suflitae]|uniref:DegT/DnrJ/EryC1/StrS family aminotransferase n=1 Tax=Desulfoferrobacter suflitae TaxID=2865782 RepID=UPI0021643AB0|nr:DegT/DnrJ/EryC1/StrS family aminotransferase [Desulfoferrobacter suflitae]MCK8601044.1 DegT/DnrJ/EryC1/StrS family aminotransferase [Desulfoferrobacter suflitae]
MEFIDLKLQQARIRNPIDQRIKAVLAHGRYIMGPEVKELEEALASYTGSRHAVGCASGTDALLLALLAHDVKPGDAVFTTPFSFIATAEAIALLGATPIFVDIDPATFNLHPENLQRAIEALLDRDPTRHPLPRQTTGSTLHPKGIIAVDLFGLPADYRQINAIAQSNGMFVIEDAAQSFGAGYFGKKAGSLAQIGCTSFFPAKPLGGYGDAGMCFTDDAALADKMRCLSLHGQGAHKYDHIHIGINGRLDTLQAAILLAKFEIFPEEVALRRQVADQYHKLLFSQSSPVLPPAVPENYDSVWAQYSVLTKKQEYRRNLLDRLHEAGIPTAIYYPKPLHLQPAFNHLGYKAGDFSVSEDYARRIFSIPMHPYLEKEQQERIAGMLLELS